MLLLRSIVVVLVVASTAAFARTEPLAATPSEVQTTIEMLEELGNKHYAAKPIDDELSKELLAKYLDDLDPSRVYFLASDIAEFHRWQTSLDDALRQGDLSQGFAIYNRYMERVVARLEKNIAFLEAGANFDFTIDESIDYSDDEDQPWIETEAELDEAWRKRIKDAYLRLLLADKEEEEIPELLIKRYRNSLKQLEQSDAEDAHERYMNSLTSLYDPHTSYYSPRQLENFKISMSLKLEGIGAVLSLEDETTSVVRIIPGGPAAKQGILAPEDKILGVGQEGESIDDVVGWRLDDVVDLIRGPKGSKVTLEIIPAKGESAGIVKTITIVRDEVKLEEQAAKSRVLEFDRDGSNYKIGVIDLPAFYIDFDAFNNKDPNFKSTTRDVAKLLEDLKAQNVDGIVLDLRNNGGGSLYEVTTMTDLFIGPGPVVQIRKDDKISRGYRSRKAPLYDGPLLVLINRLSASASEIFAGAIQDYGRGLVVGTRSYGKGTVQALVPLHEGQVKLTESKFYRVSGESTQHRGVLPDISLPSLYDVDDIGESSREHALPWDKIHGIPVRKENEYSEIVKKLNKKHEERSLSDADFVYLVKQLELSRQRREDKEVSLNLETRKRERDEFEQSMYRLANERRLARHQEPFATIEAWREFEEPSQENQQTGEETEIPIEDDPLLKEAGFILLDQIRLTGKPSMEIVEQRANSEGS